ncbi:MAG: cytochrome c family protein [Desulfobacula sp.]|nr:cytochrome c family protein [Desulfobacula sp.]
MKYLLAFLIGTLFLITTLVAFSSQNLERLEPSGFENTRRPGAVFDHDLHNENAQLDDCATCHHLYENGAIIDDESSEDSSCSECHLLSSNQDNKITLQVAFHRQCKECHYEEKKGPVFCGECHIKE